MNNIGITPDEWNALSAGSTVTLHHVPFDREDDYMTGDRLAVVAQRTVQNILPDGEIDLF